MEQVFVGMGSNINREVNIQRGLVALGDLFGELLLSNIYESISYGFDGDNFYNLVAGFFTDKNPAEVARMLRDTEYEFGRIKKVARYSSRTLDIDLLLYGDLISDNKNLRIPREDILKYSFVLCPLAEIAPELKHPVVKKSYKQLWLDYEKSGDDLWKVDMDLSPG